MNKNIIYLKWRKTLAHVKNNPYFCGIELIKQFKTRVKMRPVAEYYEMSVRELLSEIDRLRKLCQRCIESGYYSDLAKYAVELELVDHLYNAKYATVCNY